MTDYLPKNLIEKLYSYADPQLVDSAYDNYVAGFNQIFQDFLPLYAPFTGIDNSTLPESPTEENIAFVIEQILNKLPEDKRSQFSKDLSEYFDKYNTAFMNNAFTKMTPEQIEEFDRFLENEEKVVEEIDKSLDQKLANPTPQPSTPAAEPRPAPTISLAPKD